MSEACSAILPNFGGLKFKSVLIANFRKTSVKKEHEKKIWNFFFCKKEKSRAPKEMHRDFEPGDFSNKLKIVYPVFQSEFVSGKETLDAYLKNISRRPMHLISSQKKTNELIPF